MPVKRNQETSGSSIKDVALAAGVSVATVSRVLNKKGYVSQEAENAVREAIIRCRYVPNMAARGLRTSRIPLIGFILPNIQNEYFANVASAIQENMLKFGYFVVFSTTRHDKEIEKKSIQMLLSQNVAGLIMIADEKTCAMVPRDVPCVGVDCYPRPEALGNFAVVHSDDEVGGYLATCELIEKGCRKIAIFTGFRFGFSHQLRLKGYKRALKEHGIAFDQNYVFYCDEITFEAGVRLVDEVLALRLEIDGIFGISDYLMQGAVDALVRNHVDIPGEIRVVGYDDSPMAERGNKKLTTIHRPTDQIAQIVTQLIIDMLAGRKAEKAVYEVPVWLVRRETT